MSTDTEEKITEDWVLSELGKDPIDAAGLQKALEADWDEGRAQKFREWTDLALEALREKTGLQSTLKLLAWRATWDHKTKYPDLISAWLGKDRNQLKLLKNSGFDKGITATAAIKRFDKLLSLEEGTMCLDKTWGFGVVQDVELFYERVEIDFERKSDHELSLAYAAETLEIIDDEHLMAIRHKDPEQLKEMISKEPAEVVKHTLKHYGPMSVIRLQEILCESILVEKEWKKFWEGARRQLRTDPQVEIPSKRNDSIVLFEREKKYDDKWFAELSENRDMAALLELVEIMVAELQEPLTDEQRTILGERLAFVLKGSGQRHVGNIARVMLLARNLEVPAEVVDQSALIDRSIEEVRLMATIDVLQARYVKSLLNYLADADEDRALALYAELIPKLDLSTLGEVVQLLTQRKKEEMAVGVFSGILKKRVATIEMLCWLSKNPAKLQAWNIVSIPDLVDDTLHTLEEEYAGDRLRTSNHLKQLYRQQAWLKTVLGAMDGRQQRNFLTRVKDSTAWPKLERQSVMGQIIKLNGELQSVLSEGSDGGASSAVSRGRFTSHRSFKEKQAQFEKIQKEDIPNNSKEIGIAREYGDLKENHEFKAAKETQGILMRREAELGDMLSNVNGSDFKNFPSDVAGVATGVEIEFPGGKEEKYWILGEWDRDEALGIISCESRLAQLLDGKKPGDKVMLPTDDGEAECILKTVKGLSDEIVAWVGQSEN